MTTIVSPSGGLVEVGPGRGDLTISSYPAGGDGGMSARGVAQVDGRHVSYARIFAEQPTVAMCAMWILRQAIRVPLKTYRRTGDDSRERVRRGDHPVATAMSAPWERAGQYDLIASLLGPAIVHGNGLLQVEQGAANALRFVPADWRFSEPIRPWRDKISGWSLDVDDSLTRRTVSVDEVVHVAWWSPLGPLGVSLLRQLGTTVQIDDAAQRYQRAMLRNGARPPSAIEVTAEFLELDAAERSELMGNLRGDISDLYAGPENAGRPALLPPGLSWKPVGHTAVEAALIEQRTVSRQEAVGIYGLMPAAIGWMHDGAELQEQRMMSYTDGLAPPLLLIEAALNAQLIQGLLREVDVYVEFDFSALLKGDRLKEVQAMREAISTGLLTPNEARAIDNRPQSDVPGMDSHYLNRANLWPVELPYPAKGMGGDSESGPVPAHPGGSDLTGE